MIINGNAPQLIRKAELLRERGNYTEAVYILDSVIEYALKNKKPYLESDARGHLIVCYKHLYERNYDSFWLDYMYTCARAGLFLNLPEVDKRVFYLRLGEFEYYRKEYDKAEVLFRKAHLLVNKDCREEAEYLAHLVSVLVARSELFEARDLLARAFVLMNMPRVRKDTRPFHRLIILAGLYLLEYKLNLRSGLGASAARKAYLKGYAIALWLKWRHKMPQRLTQFKKLTI